MRNKDVHRSVQFNGNDSQNCHIHVPHVLRVAEKLLRRKSKKASRPMKLSVTRCVSIVGSKESGKSAPRSCRRSRGVRKRCRIRAGWRHEWIPRSGLPSPNVLAIREVVRGPFSSPLLVGASPYVLISSYSRNSISGARCPKIRRGIPDPWAEYLAYRGFCGKEAQRTIRHDLDLGCKNIYVTATVWKNLGLPLGQGIPDPWKIPEQSSGRSCRKDRSQRCENCKGWRTSSPPASKTKTLQRSVNLTPKLPSRIERHEKIRKPSDCTALCDNPDHRSRTPSDAIASAPPLTLTHNEEFFRISSTVFPKRVERDGEGQRKESFVASTMAKIYQEKTSARELSRNVPSPKKSKAVEVQTSATILSPSPPPKPTRCFCNQGKSTSCHCDLRRLIKPGDFICGIEPRVNPHVKDAACSCEARDFWQRRVDFEPVYDNGRQNLNVTRLECGCVHISPCFIGSGTPGFIGSGNGGGSVGLPRVASPPEGGFHRDSVGQKLKEFPARESPIPKPKMMSRMRRLLNRCKPHGKSQPETGGLQDNASRIPEEAKLVCCQCSCPYLKVKSSSQKEPVKPSGRRKGRCKCERCVAKRERREKRRNNREAVEEKQYPVDPRFSGRNQRRSNSTDQMEPKMMIKCDSGNPENPRSPCKSCKVRTYDLSKDLDGTPRNLDGEDLREARNEHIVTKEKLRPSPEVKRPCGETRVLETFGAPWYSSDSGENADVSETSKHIMQCVGTLEAAPETALVTSCTFISRINHKTVLECLKRHQRRGKREETKMRPTSQNLQDLDSESFAGRRSRRLSERRQTLTPTSTTVGFAEPKTGENQIPLLDIKEPAINDSQPLPRAACTDPATSLASSFYKDEQTSGSTHLLSGDKKSLGRLTERENFWRKDNQNVELNSPRACSSKVSLDVDLTPDYNRPPGLSSHRSYLNLQKARLGTEGETENSTYASSSEHRVAEAFGEVQKSENSKSNKAKLTAAESPHSNFEREPMITTIVSPRRIFTDSSTTGNPGSSAKKSDKAHAPANSPVDTYSSSENQGLVTSKKKSSEAWCELPFTPVPCPAKCLPLGSQAICSRAKVDGFLEGEGPENSDYSIADEFPGDESRRTLFSKGVQREAEKRTLADNKCFLKYCSLRRSGPFAVENQGNGVPGVTERELPIGRRVISSSGNQRNAVLLPFQPSHDEVFTCLSPRPLIKIQDKFNVG